MPTCSPIRRAALAAGVLTLAVPAAASATVTQQVQNDGSVYTNITPGLAITNVEPRVTIVAASEDLPKYYKYTVVGPNGAPVAVDNACLKLQFGPIARLVQYVGNGTYTMTTTLYSDNACATPTTGGATGQFTINAAAAIQTPTTPLLTRDPGSFARKTYSFPTGVTVNARQEILYKNFGVFDPTVGISGATPTDSLFSLNGAAQVTFPAPGRYTFTTRAKGGSTPAYTPWTAPQFVDVKGPFDLDSTRYIDNRGPSYRIRLKFRENVNGKVRLRLRKSGKYRTIGTVTAKNGVLTKRFTARSSGRYQLRAEFQGSALVAPGTITLGFRVTRRFI